MSQENVEAVRTAFEQFAQGDMSGLLTAFTDDFELATATEMPDGGTYSGSSERFGRRRRTSPRTRWTRSTGYSPKTIRPSGFGPQAEAGS
jgi:ketosteroid isomerase-like protein